MKDRSSTGQRPSEPTGAARRLRIFVVENHPDTLKYLCLYLEQMGHVVASARSKSESIELLARRPCDVLISDIGLPDGNGWELLQQAPAPKPHYAIALLLLSVCFCELAQLFGVSHYNKY